MSGSSGPHPCAHSLGGWDRTVEDMLWAKLEEEKGRKTGKRRTKTRLFPEQHDKEPALFHYHKAAFAHSMLALL